MKKKYAALVIVGWVSVTIITALLTLRNIKIENELIETCGTIDSKVSVKEMEEAIREKYPQADETKVAASVEIAPNTDIWLPVEWQIAVGPTGVTQHGLGPLRIIRHKWHLVNIGERAKDRYMQRGTSVDMRFFGYGFARVKSRKSSADANCEIEKTAFTNWYY